MPDVTRTIQGLAAQAEPYVVGQRRRFHSHPEPSWHEVWTTKAICGELDAMGVSWERPTPTGCVATLRGTAPDAYDASGRARRRLLLRADIDALPIEERTGAPFASECPGVMHACGHDCHIAMMLGTLQVLRQLAGELHGEVRVVFQPAEEVAGGSALMIEHGVLDGVDGVYGTHIWSEIDAGLVSLEAGPRMANVDWFRIDVTGEGCHGAMPDRGCDAVVAAAAIVGELQTIVSRELSPLEPAVVTVGELHGGTAKNVIAGSASLTGTVRTFGESTHERMPELVGRVARHTAAAHGATAELTEYLVGNRAVVNDPASSARARAAAERVLGPDAVGTYAGTMSGEDFSSYLERVPGVFVLLGTRNPTCGATWPQHSPCYTVDESVLVRGVMLAAQYACDFLAEA